MFFYYYDGRIRGTDVNFHRNAAGDVQLLEAMYWELYEKARNDREVLRRMAGNRNVPDAIKELIAESRDPELLEIIIESYEHVVAAMWQYLNEIKPDSIYKSHIQTRISEVEALAEKYRKLLVV